MRGHLTAINGVCVAHGLLDEGVTCAGLDRAPTSLRNQVLRVPNNPGIVNYCGARIFCKKCIRKQAYDIFAVDEGSRVIKEEAAVKITVPCHTEVSA